MAELKEKDDTLEDLVLLLTQFIEALHVSHIMATLDTV